MKYALLFGINYKRSPQARLRGCINDVNNMAEYLRKDLKYDHVKVYTDENNIHETGIQNIIHKIYKLAILSHRQKINQVYLHFSGHGTSTFDKNRDEKDGKDEAFVPSDYQHRGVISDDLFKRIFKIFNENTKVICIFDCCHSGTIADLKYKWVSEDRKSIENNDRPCRSNIITISGCSQDTGTILRWMHCEVVMYMSCVPYVMYGLFVFVVVAIAFLLTYKTKTKERCCYQICDGCPSHV